MNRRRRLNGAINIGVQEGTVKAAHMVILAIMKVEEADSSVKIAALETLTRMTQVNGSTISQCTFTGVA